MGCDVSLKYGTYYCLTTVRSQHYVLSWVESERERQCERTERLDHSAKWSCVQTEFYYNSPKTLSKEPSRTITVQFKPVVKPVDCYPNPSPDFDQSPSPLALPYKVTPTKLTLERETVELLIVIDWSVDADMGTAVGRILVLCWSLFNRSMQSSENNSVSEVFYEGAWAVCQWSCLWRSSLLT